MIRITTFFVLVSALATPVSSHERSESYSHWYAGDTVTTGTVTIPLREVMLLYQTNNSSVPPAELFRHHLESHTSLKSDDGECEVHSANTLDAPSGFVRAELNFNCNGGVATTLHYRALFDIAPGHVHYAKWHRDDRVTEVLLTDSDDHRTFTTDNSGPASSSFLSYLQVGITHIGTGYDHIAFLLGLLLISGSIGRTVIAVTGFTLGHSISLAAAVLGYVSADGRLVEAFIGFTVALVAVEYFVARRDNVTSVALMSLVIAFATGIVAVQMGLLQGRAIYAYLGFGVFAACYLLAAQRTHGRMPMLLFAATACFGLVHGFGFAGFLMDTGFAGGALLVPLLGFNLGVEIGQLLLVAAALTASAIVGNWLPRAAPALAAAGLCAVGLFWFVSRTIA